MNLKPEHIYPYMPYGLEIEFNGINEVYTIYAKDFTDFDNNKYPLSTLIFCLGKQDKESLPFKLLLKPLSDLTPKLLNDIEMITGTSGIVAVIEKIRSGYIDYILMVQLFKQHYDVFGLIENGLAEAKK